MCGIYFSAARHNASSPDSATVDALKARGPDSYRLLHVTVPTSPEDSVYLTFASSVLGLRGKSVQEQPLRDPSSGSLLCWNGEAWTIEGLPVRGNDSAQVFEVLLRAARTSAPDDHSRVAEALTAVAGPFAFVFYSAFSSTIYYGRDRLGRRCLLANQHGGQILTLSSIDISSATSSCTEVSTEVIHYISLQNNAVSTCHIPWVRPQPKINKISASQSPGSIPSNDSVQDLLKHLSTALEVRVRDIPEHFRPQLAANSAKVALLFSGGLDCTLLARLVHEILPQDEAVDLLNVAFENPRSLGARFGNTDSPYELCPDRITGRSSFSELCKVCPARNWRFIAIDVPYPEALTHKPTIIKLMQPHNTEMDLSIAMALYFAARGQGNLMQTGIYSDSEIRPFTSTARVLLSGLGADELYAGYSRHAAAFVRGGYSDLADELELDFNRIGSRNLGRDDRVMSHWGKEVRYPYLDEDFVRFSLGLPVWEKSGFRPERGVPKHYEEVDKVAAREQLEPAKMLLRLALWQLDMRTAAAERKRAIQFGARTAKMDLGKGRTKGTDILAATS